MTSFQLPTGRRRRLLTVAAIVVVLGGLLVLLAHALERQREADSVRAMADTVAGLRAAVDTCKSDLARAEADFRRFDAEVDSLRARIGRYETMDPEGVPAAEYEAYLRTFDRYNASTGEWEMRVDSLRASETSCRGMVERHNRLADSLRVRMEALGIDLGG